MQAAATAVRGFTADLYRTLAATRAGGNVVCAPYSVGLALAMTRAGAGSTTADEMDAVLHAPHPRPRALDSGLNTVEQALAGRYQDGDGVRQPRLTTANALWTRLDLILRPGFRDALAGYYGAAPHPVDFRGAPEVARQEINTWVSDRTNAKIPELLQSDAVSRDTSLVLTNAIYLKAAWKYPFTATATAVGPFTGTTGSLSTSLSCAGRSTGWATSRGRVARGRRAVRGRRACHGHRHADPGQSRRGRGEPRCDLAGRVADRVPDHRRPTASARWTFRLPAELGAALSGLGMPTAFTSQADFTAMSTEPALCIDDVVHETFIAVDEKGTEAAAASAVIVRPPSIPQGPQFFVNRPFLYVIHDRITGVPLFLGRVHDPLVDGPA
ncbi:serpin family protein [Micromonospora sp. M12]